MKHQKEILIGTTNPSKVGRFAELLSEYAVRFYTLKDLDITEEPEETGSTPEENARQKALFYGQYFDAVICNDSGLYIKELPLEDPRQPGLHIRTPGGGARLEDEEMIAYYAGLVHSLGGKVTAYYLDGIAVFYKGNLSTFMDPEADGESAFYLLDQPSPKRKEGWPLDSLSINRNTLTYFTEGGNNQYDTQKEEIILGEYRKRMVQFLAETLELEICLKDE